MKKIFGNIIAIFLTLGLVFGGPTALVFADDPSPFPSPTASTSSDPSPSPSTTDSSNTNTGSTSNNTSNTTTDQTNTATNNNTSNTTNNTTANSTSGTNDSNSNTGNATVNTSSAATNTTTNTTTNTNTYAPMSWTSWTGDGDWQSRSTNGQTGSTSNNTANTTSNETNNLTNTNNAIINNTTNATSDTGTNNALNNTGDAAITTGNASTIAGNQNVANVNATAWTGNGDWTTMWNGEALNYLTGAHSDNTAATNFTKVLDVLNQNGVDINNLLGASANSGGNNASQNTGNATIQTGNSSVLATLFNLANSNIFGTDAINILYQDIYGQYSGDVNLSNATPLSLQSLLNNPTTVNSSNSLTGSGSTNNSTVNGSLFLDVLNQNSGSLENNLNLNSITGGNNANDNTGNGSVTTGDASIIANLINFLNANIFTNSFYLGVVNVYGDWSGNLILPQYNGSSGGSANLSLAGSNFKTGSNSDNNSNTNLTTNSTLNNNNDGTVQNDFNLALATGGNSSSDNTLNGIISTGNAAGDVNQANLVNTNFVSNDPWWIILVNNMGHWTPMLFSPHLSNGAQIVLDLDSLGLSGNSQTTVNGQGGGQAGALNQAASNNLTGSTSDNNATTNLTATTNITNNNDGSIINNVDALASTGNNSASRNTGSGDITTGNANVLVNAINFLNANFVTPSFMVTIVNVFGSWAGDVLNFGQTQTVASVNSTANGITNIQSNNSPQGGQSNNDPGNNNTSPNNNSTNNPPVVQTSTTTTGGITINSVTINPGALFNNGNGGNAQVLSFHEQSNPGSGSVLGTSQNSNLDKYFMIQKSWAIALSVLALMMVVSYLQRGRLLKIIKRSRFHLF